MLKTDLIRREYPDLENVAYFNTSSIALPPVRAKEAVHGYLSELTDDYCLRANEIHDGIMDDARKELAALLDCSPKEIAFTKNTCDGITQFVQSYPFREGDNVVITDQEYPSNFYPWLSLEQKGIEVRVTPFENGELMPEQILARCDKKTRAVGLASTFFCNGFRMDLKRLGELCHERGILLIVDSIQSLGRLSVKPKELGIDFLANGGHKCLLGMKGAGFLYCDEALRPLLTPYTACRQSLSVWHRPPLERHYVELPWRPDAGVFESGNPNYIGILAMSRGVSLINELGIEEIEAHVLELETKILDRLEPLGFSVTSHRDEAHRSGIFFIHIPEGTDEKAIDRLLVKHGVYATVREGYIRISIHFFNTVGHGELLAAALEEVRK